MIGIYKITNIVNGKVYIGQSTNINKRWASHKSEAFNPKSDAYDYPLYRAIRKYGLNNFLFEVLEECLSSQLDEKEIAFIKEYNAHGEGGYNQDDGGWNAIHGKLTFDDIAEIHKSLKDRKMTMREIAKQYDVHYNTIKTINNGTAWVIDGVEYPIRKTPVSRSEQKIRAKDNNVYVPVKKRTFTCPICGKIIVTEKAKMCKTCDEKRQRKVMDRPSALELARLVKENGFTRVGKQFGVDGNTIKKWCKSYGIPYKLQELIEWYDTKMNIPHRQRQIQQIDLNTGNVLNTFDSVSAIAKHMGRSDCDNIMAVCNGKRKSAYGYGWKIA